MTTAQKVVVIAIAGLIMLIVFGGSFFQNSDTKNKVEVPINQLPKPEPAPPPLIGRFVFPKEFRKEFMDACTDTGDVTYGYCECTLDYFGTHFGVEKSLEIAKRTEETGIDQPEMWEAANACVDKLLL